MFKKAAVSGLGLLFLVSPLFTSADTVSDLQAQIQALLAQLSQLQIQLNKAAAPSNVFCHTFNVDLKYGDQWSLVANNSAGELSFLQTALEKEGFVIGNPDANARVLFFGESTAEAVVKFQARYGIKQTGYVGPVTRSKLNKLYGCGNSQSVKFSAFPASGFAPLSVGFSAASQNGTKGDVTYYVDFGDGKRTENMPWDNGKGTPDAWSASVYHDYNQPGTYIATLGSTCSTRGCEKITWGIANATVVVNGAGGAMAPTISSVSPASAKIGETVYVYGSNFNQYTFIAVDGAYGVTITPTVLSSTSLRFVVPSSVGVGTHTLQVNEKAAAFPLSNSFQLTVTGDISLQPAIRSIVVDMAGNASITGNYLSGNTKETTGVFIGDLRAKVTYASDTLVNIEIPSALVVGWDYDVYIKNEKGESNTYRIKIASVKPSASISPLITATGAKAAGNFEVDAGGEVSIYGSNLATPDSTRVYIGGRSATVTWTSDGQVNAKVPPSLTPGESYDLYISNQYGMSNIVRVKVLSVTYPSVDITSPGGGAYVQAGKPIHIAWQSTNELPGASVNLSYTVCMNGCIKTPIMNGLSPDGSYDFLTLPAGNWYINVDLLPSIGGFTPGQGSLVQVIN